MTAPMPKDNEVEEKVTPEPLTYGMRRKGETAIIGLIPPKVHANPPKVPEYLRDYEEVPLYSAATVAELRAEVERLRTDAYKFRRLARLLDGFDFRLGRNVLMPPATYLDSVEITCEFQPGVGQSVIDAIMDTLTGADPT